eukprot:SAG31_NODE_3955_length_3720_cov_1.847556_3_plen_67_part_00
MGFAATLSSAAAASRSRSFLFHHSSPAISPIILFSCVQQLVKTLLHFRTPSHNCATQTYTSMISTA